MNVSPEQISTASKAGVEMWLGIANAQFAAFERLAALNLNAAKSAFEAGMGQTRALCGAKDAQDVVKLSAAAAQPSFENAIAYSHSIYELATQTQGEMNKIFESQTSDFSRNMTGFLDKVSKNAPAGSDVAVAAVKSALAAANSAYDSMNKMAKQASEIAEANFSAATNAAREARKKAA